jgi:serine/threonine-protein kinase HipA
MAPVYDVVTTTVSLPKDILALQLDGSTRWPTRKQLLALAVQRCKLSEAQARPIFEMVADAMSDAAAEMRVYAKQHPEFVEIAGLMLAQWEIGLSETLGHVPSTWVFVR